MEQNRVLEALEEYFGYSAFRLHQSDVIARCLAGQNSLVIMPTGGGKSLCYQLPSVLLDGMTIVVSPLIALMQDQVASLQASGIFAEALNSACTMQEEAEIRGRVERDELKLLYVSPERAVSAGFLAWIGRQKVSQIAIDEAHCVSMWGNDFRPEYTRLKELTACFPSVPVMALTATADGATRHDILYQLDLAECEVFLSSFERKNIQVDVLPAQNRIGVMLRFLKSHHQEPGIVYCLSRKSTEQVAEKLRQAGYVARHYHAAMSADERKTVQDSFLKDEVQVICATIAFGMGIDKPNIRWVVHYNLPKNIESYYQEVGRAGRDGEPSEALLFAGYGDMRTLAQFIDDGEGNEQFKALQHAKLSRMWEYTQATSCRTNFVLSYFGEHREQNCGHCDRCLNPPKSFDGTIIAQKALSACYRLSQQVSMNMLIDVLRGSSSREVISRGYDQIKTYGAGQDIDWKGWRHYITQLIDRGYLSIDYTRHNAIVLTELSRAVLKGEVNVELCEAQEVDFKSKQLNTPVIEDFDRTLFEILKQLRRELAESDDVKPFTIFSDASLKDMARKKPGSLEALMDVSGVGTYKRDKYGETFLASIRSNTPENELAFHSEKAVPAAKPRTTDDFSVGPLSETHLETLALYQRGYGIRDIAQERALSVSTIERHLYRLKLNGKNVDLSALITPQQISYIQNLWQALDRPQRIKNVYEEAEEGIDYEQIRFAVSLLRKDRALSCAS